MGAGRWESSGILWGLLQGHYSQESRELDRLRGKNGAVGGWRPLMGVTFTQPGAVMNAGLRSKDLGSGPRSIID